MGVEPIPHVLILGGGFAGLWAARALRRAPVRITLLDRCNHHVFQPLLYQVAAASLAAPQVSAPIRYSLRRQKNTTVLFGEVTAIDVPQRRVASDIGDFTYDFLIVATGATHAYFGHDDWAAQAPGLKTLDDAFRIRRHILTAFERAETTDDADERRAWQTFVVVGAGPTGVELAGTLAEMAHHTLRGEFRRSDPSRSRVILVEAGPRVLPALHPSLSQKALGQLVRLGVDVRVAEPVTSIDGGHVTFGKETVTARTIIWAAGVAASPLGRQLGAATDRSGRVLVAPDLSLPDHPEVFVAGDLAAVTQQGAPVPGIAPAAKQMGRHAAAMIRARLSGGRPRAFRYIDMGSLATIGRMKAVIQYKRFRMSGGLAWWIWLVAHIWFLIGFRNRLSVMIDWAWAYLSHERTARIILGRDEIS